MESKTDRSIINKIQYDIKTNDMFEKVKLNKTNFNIEKNINLYLTAVQDMTNLLEYDAPRNSNKNYNKNKNASYRAKKLHTNRTRRKFTFTYDKDSSKNLNSSLVGYQISPLNECLNSPPNSVKNKKSVQLINLKQHFKSFLSPVKLNKPPALKTEGDVNSKVSSKINNDLLNSVNIDKDVTEEIKLQHLQLFDINNNLNILTASDNRGIDSNIFQTQSTILPEIYHPSAKIGHKKADLKQAIDKYLKITRELESLDKQAKDQKSAIPKYLRSERPIQIAIPNPTSDEVSNIINSNLSPAKRGTVFLYNINKMVTAEDLENVKDINSLASKNKKEDQKLFKMDNIGAYKFRKVLAEKYGMEKKKIDRLNLGQKTVEAKIRNMNHQSVEKILLDSQVLKRKIMNKGDSPKL